MNEAVFNYGEWLTFYKKTLFLGVSGDDTISNSCNLDLVFAISYLKLPGFEMADLQRLQKIADELKASKMVLNRMQKDQTELDEEKRLLLERMMRRGK